MAGTIRFARVLESGHVPQVEIYIHHGNSLSKVKSFALHLKTKTTAEIREATAIIQSQVNSASNSNDFQSLAHAARIFVRCDSTGQLFSFFLPAPDIAIFEEQPEGDLIVTPEEGEIFAGWYSDLAGEAFTFDGGAFVGIQGLY
jgi:hypothetical protein